MTALKRTGQPVLLVLALVMITACSPAFRNHGHVPRDTELAAVQIGQDTRETVAQKIGAPAMDGLRTKDAWYYVESRFRKVAFQAPQEIERTVLRIVFGSGGTVSNIERFGLEDGQVVRLSSRVTETIDTDPGFLRAIFGRLGGGGNFGGLLN
jgi:outer membrane protein assembly factor BamE (lipoprotein component of BamABCDE complex)